MPTPRTPRPSVRRQPQRTCVACRDTNDKRSLTRLVRSPDGHVRLDRTGRAAGRGAYLCEQPECWERALGRADVLGRALKATLSEADRAAIREQATSDRAPHDEQTYRDADERAGERE